MTYRSNPPNGGRPFIIKPDPAASPPATPPRRQSGSGWALFVLALVLVVFQLNHWLTFGWLYTALAWLAVAGGMAIARVIVWAIRRTP
jgi:hypothetical protein